jgi:hypothetical protein
MQLTKNIFISESTREMKNIFPLSIPFISSKAQICSQAYSPALPYCTLIVLEGTSLWRTIDFSLLAKRF